MIPQSAVLYRGKGYASPSCMLLYSEYDGEWHYDAIAE
jgi:hypothetical protein